MHEFADMVKNGTGEVSGPVDILVDAGIGGSHYLPPFFLTFVFNSSTPKANAIEK